MPDRPTLREIEFAAGTLRPNVIETPLVPFSGSGATPETLLKLEIHQVVGSFKIRGVLHAVQELSKDDRGRGLMTVSAGNTAQALAWCGRFFGVPARSLMPDTAPETKIDAVRRLGGEPVLVPTAEVFRFLQEQLWVDEPYAFIHPWIDRNVMIGHGSLGLEIARELPEVQTVYVPVGGGGLMGGVASALKSLVPSARIVAVEPEGCPALERSLREGRPTRVECLTMCDGVAVPYITDEMFPILQELVDDVILVSEEAVADAIRRLAIGNRIVVEPAGALSVAAAVNDARRAAPAVCLITGGSIDAQKLAGILSDG